MSYRVLIVDDSSVVRHMVRRALSIAGIEADPVFEAGNGQEALAVLRENWIDIVFADINMPVMSGAELLETMARDGMLGTTPVVIVSSERSEKRAQEMRQLGARAFVVKPLRPETIRQVCSEILHPGKEAHHD